MSSTIRIVQSVLRPTRNDENNLEKLAKLKTKFILVEKPIYNSIKNIDEMIKICREKK